jgi:hypothetical protein
MTEHFREFLAALLAEGARFMLVGAHALAVHGIPRMTADLDVWIEPSEDNAERVWRALVRFGAPVDAMNLTATDLTQPDVIAQIGLPPARVDVLTGIDGVEFAGAWSRRSEAQFLGLTVSVLSRTDLIANKSATGRERDRLDVAALERQRPSVSDSR